MSTMDEIVQERRNKYHSGLSGIYKHFRKQQGFMLWGGIPLLTGIVRALQDAGISFSKAEFYYAFRQIPKDDYAPKDKRKIIRSILDRDLDACDKNRRFAGTLSHQTR